MDIRDVDFKTIEFPTLWGPQCEYCQKWHNAHENAVLRKAALLCKQPHWLDWVKADLDLLDHSKVSNPDIMHFLIAIHTKTDCHCLDQLLEEVILRTPVSVAPGLDQLPDPRVAT